MKKNTKKKVFTLMLVIMLLSIAIVGGSLAWFTAEDEVTNTFTVGSIKIVQHEQQHNDEGELVDFKQDKTLMPIVNVNDPASDKNYEEKIVTVENTGKNSAYVRTHIAIPTALVDYLILDTSKDGWDLINDKGTTTTVNGVSYTVYTYNYSKELPAGETTSILLNGVYLDAKTDVQKNLKSNNLEFCYRDNGTGEFVFSGFAVTDAEGTSYKVNVLVLTQAVQAEGFNDAKQALTSAFEEKIPEFKS